MSIVKSLKQCYVCQSAKPLESFCKNKSKPDGLATECRDCVSKRNKRLSREGKLRERYHRMAETPEGRAAISWNNLNTRVKKHKCYQTVRVLVSREEFMAWAIPELQKWMLDNPGKVPSVDRKDGNGHYEIGNMQILEYQVNCGKTRRSINSSLPDGFKKCGQCEQTLPFDKFKKVKPGATGTFGLYGWCVECTRAYDRERSKKKYASKQSQL